MKQAANDLISTKGACRMIGVAYGRSKISRTTLTRYVAGGDISPPVNAGRYGPWAVHPKSKNAACDPRGYIFSRKAIEEDIRKLSGRWPRVGYVTNTHEALEGIVCKREAATRYALLSPLFIAAP